MVQHSLTVSASHVVRMYLWDLLRKYMPNEWKLINGTAIPIIPAQEQPEYQDSGQPYMVYIYDVNSTGPLYHLESESLSIVIYSQDASLIAATTKLITKTLNKYDDTARDINRWIHHPDGLQKYATGNTSFDMWMDEFKKFRFKTVNIAGTSGAQPAPGEGRRMDSVINISITFTEKGDRIKMSALGDSPDLQSQN